MSPHLIEEFKNGCEIVLPRKVQRDGLKNQRQHSMWKLSKSTM